MSKQKPSNSVLDIDHVINDINTWLVDEDYDRDKVENDLDDLCDSWKVYPLKWSNGNIDDRE